MNPNVKILAQNWLSMSPYFFDTETTGTDGLAEVIELAVVDCNGVLVFDRLYKPIRQLPKIITEITTITEAMIADRPHISKDVTEILDLFRGKVLVAYNGNFDERMLIQSFLTGKVPLPKPFLPYKALYDVMKLFSSYREVPNAWGNGYKWFKLKESTDFMEIEPEAEFHRAAADAAMTRRLLIKLGLG
jgi:DNA polymerase III subunit epsilon